MFIIGTIICFALAIGFLVLMNRDHILDKKTRVDFPLFFFLGIVAYMLLPLMEVCVNGVENYNADMGFMIDVIIALFSLLLGASMGEIKRECFGGRRINTECILVKNEMRKGIVAVTVAVLFTTTLYIMMIFGGIRNYISQQYGLYNATNMNSMTAVLPYFAVAYIIVMNNTRIIQTTKKMNFLIKGISVFFIGIYMLGGNRNLGAMMGIALVISCFYEKRISLMKYIPAFVLLILAMGIIAVGREYGMINFLTGRSGVTSYDITRYIFSVKDGEFGTMRRFYEYFGDYNYIPYARFGYSYVVAPIINLIPSILWRGRPATMAADYTSQYWIARKEVSAIGLGFSPIVEAKINFGFLWPIVFFVLGFLIFEIYFKSRNYTSRFFLAGACSSIVLNFFRIDFAVTFKFFLIVFLSCRLIYWWLRIQNENARTIIRR